MTAAVSQWPHWRQNMLLALWDQTKTAAYRALVALKRGQTRKFALLGGGWLSGVADKGVGQALLAKAALGAMAGDEDGVVAHRPQALGDAVDQLLVVALRKIRAANAAGKQHIADKGAVDLR